MPTLSVSMSRQNQVCTSRGFCQEHCSTMPPLSSTEPWWNQRPRRSHGTAWSQPSTSLLSGFTSEATASTVGMQSRKRVMAQDIHSKSSQNRDRARDHGASMPPCCRITLAIILEHRNSRIMLWLDSCKHTARMRQKPWLLLRCLTFQRSQVNPLDFSLKTS
jgi:hypothetical protein